MPTPEQLARENIDDLLTKAGWKIQDVNHLNLGESLGVAIREYPTNSGPADYILFVERKAVGVIEAKSEGTTLSGVSEQTYKYAANFKSEIPHVKLPLPFLYESTGTETLFRDLRDPESRSRRVFAFHRPETLLEWSNQPETLRSRVKQFPKLQLDRLWKPQFEAINNLEESLKQNRPRALIQMATGSGKTFTSISFIYRLIKFAGAKRILFLVDRNNLGRQTKSEFTQFVAPDDGRKFTELYNVQHLTSNTIDPVNRVVITTIQRLFSMLKGEDQFEPDSEESSMFDITPTAKQPIEVKYNPKIPIETFDFIVTDECHRSIYNLWRQALEYFDAFLIGLTATPSKQTIGFFNRNLVQEYTHERAVADNVNVDFEVYKIQTKISTEGSKIDSGFFIDKRDKLTRKVISEKLDEEFQYANNQLDRSVVAIDQIRTIIRTFRDRLFTEIFPGRTHVPKTLIFAKDDSHAEDIVNIVREEFGKGNDFCKKITYRTTGDKPEDLIANFRNSYNPRIAVTVDMISTGTDIKPIECVFFMRDVKSPIYFEQMKGRGTRVINSADLQSVTPDAKYKTHFVIVDAVGVTESEKVAPTTTLEKNRTIPFDKLLKDVAVGIRTPDILSSLASRLTRLDKIIDKDQKEELKKLSENKPLSIISNGLLSAIDPDIQIETAKKEFNTEEPTDQQIKEVTKKLTDEACKVFDNPKFRDKLSETKRLSEQIIDVVSLDEVLTAEFDEKSKEKAKSVIDTWKKFIDENKDEITALQIIFNTPYGKRHLTYEQIKQLSLAIEKPPYNLRQEVVWKAYEQLDKSKVKGTPLTILTNIISLLRFTIGEAEELIPFNNIVEQKFANWISEQEQKGRIFSIDQIEWLTMIKNHIATSLEISKEDFDSVPFYEKGGLMKVYNLFGEELNTLLEELNNRLVA
ncbi:MAG: DEAD/DEAH box helicase family protein [Ignavibacteriae bacterium]|nr:DEAD/DEAH box helicase family protein [Ignavibacteriota bacterium]